MPVTRSILDTRYVHIPVRSEKAGVVVDPQGDDVYFAFLPDKKARPVDGVVSDWALGDWETRREGASLIYLARFLVGSGPGGKSLALGRWWIWLRITDNPEAPVEQVDWIDIV